MKTLYLIKNRIWAYMHTNLFIFLLYCVGTILAFATMILFYCSFVSSNKYYEDDGYYIYSVNLADNEGEKNIGIEIEKLFSDNRGNIIWYGAIDIMSSNDLFGDGKEQSFYITNCYNNVYEDAFTGRVDLAADMERGIINPVILPREHTRDDLRVGDSIEICGSSHTIVGFHAQSEPYVFFHSENSIFEDRKYCIYKFSYTQPLDDEEIEALKRFVSASFGNAKIKLPITPKDRYENEFISGISTISLISMVAIVAFIFLYSYLLYSRRNESIIMSICGASRNKIIGIVVLENIILNAMFSVIAIITYEVLKEPLFSKLLSSYQMKLEDYCIVFCCFIIMNIVTALPFFYNYRKASVITARNEV